MRETKRAYGWPEDAQFLVPDGVTEHFAEGIGKRGAELQRRLGGAARRLRERATPSSPPRSRRCSGASCPTAGTPTIPSFDADEKGIATRKASQQGPERDRRAPALAARRLRRPHRLDLGPARLRRRRRLRARRSYDGRQLHFGIREHESAAISNGLSLSKLRPLWSTYLTFSDYARPGDPALGADGAAGDPPLHPRLDRARRGRPDPPAGRAARLAAGDPRPRRDPPRRRQRGRRGLAGGDRPHPPAGRAGPHPPERAGPRPLQVRLGRGPAARRLRARRRRGRRPRA